MSTKAAQALAALIGAAGAVTAVAVASGRSDTLNEAAVALVIVAYAGIGLLILWHRPGHPIGRLMLGSAAVWGVGEGLLEIAVHQLDADPTSPWASAAATLGSAARGMSWLVLVLWLPLWFPDGRLAGPPRLRRVARALSLTTLSLYGVVSLLSPDETDLRIADVDNAFGLPHAVRAPMDALSGVCLLLAIATIGLAVTCLISRWRHESEFGRQQLLIFALAFIPPIALFVLSIWDLAEPWMFGVASLPVPIAIGVAVLQHRLYDIQLVLNRSLTYGVLWLAVAGLYAITIGGVGALLQRQGADWLPWVAAGVVAVSFAPLRDALQRAANKLTYGQWSQPAEVLAGVGRRLSDATDVPGLLQTLAHELCSSLGLTKVEMRDADDVLLASSGDGVTTDSLPLIAYGTQVGWLRWNGRLPREADRALLGDVANQLGSVLHAATLLKLVRASQERLVLAREEERKRLRRDLHDGLGPTLAGLTLQVDTMRNQPVVGDDSLLQLRDGIQSAVVDVRRLVDGLRPPAIDELGLLEAVTQMAGRLGRDSGVEVHVQGERLPPLPAAVEVAAYRISQEALTNAVRHARASRCIVQVSSSTSGLLVRVSDDGVGCAKPRTGGIGLASMRDRAEEIGGSLSVESLPAHGTSVVATLPIEGVPT